MKRSIHKGIFTNQTMRRVYNPDKKKYENKSDKYTCSKTNCKLCQKITNNKKTKNNKIDLIFYY